MRDSVWERRTSSKIEEIALKAAEDPEIIDAYKNAPNELEALRLMRSLLDQKYGAEIESLPPPEVLAGSIVGGMELSNNFIIAKNIVSLLRNEKI